jgi:hypothetical protein
MINESLENIDFTSPVRHNILGSHKNIEKKVEYNLKSCFEEVDESKKESLIKNLQDILSDEESKNHSYRYCWAAPKAK